MNDNGFQFKSAQDCLDTIAKKDIRFIDMNFTDMNGRWHHITEHVSAFDEGKIKGGIFFDGSSISGWRDIHESDMILIPDLSHAVLDPFSAQPTLKVFCDVYDPKTNAPYTHDPRSIAKRAEQFLADSGIADTAYFGPEPEFFVFEHVKISTAPHKSGFFIDSPEFPHNSDQDYDGSNTGHRPKAKGGYVPEAPIDNLSDIRGEMLTVIEAMGVGVEKHHHEVAPAQCELGIKFAPLLSAADQIQIYKYAVHNVANSYGKTATFMPKPIYGDNGSGMHVHQSLWKRNKPLFAGNKYAELSDTALYYIGGIIKHARALNAFTNPSVNSYKRLVPGYEAPVLLAYSASNRSAACRIPHSGSANGKRVEIRFPDPLANPYLALSALMMAGLDGIENKIDPGEALDKNLYALSKEELAPIPTVCSSLREALETLRNNHEFLIHGDVFTREFIEDYIALKMQEVELYETSVHPIEYQMYYSG